MAPTPLPGWLNRDEFPFQPNLIELGNGEQLSVTDVGSAGPNLIFSHGTPTWSYEWRHHLRTFADTTPNYFELQS
jgi:haloalkane dehalogenase